MMYCSNMYTHIIGVIMWLFPWIYKVLLPSQRVPGIFPMAVKVFDPGAGAAVASGSSAYYTHCQPVFFFKFYKLRFWYTIHNQHGANGKFVRDHDMCIYKTKNWRRPANLICFLRNRRHHPVDCDLAQSLMDIDGINEENGIITMIQLRAISPKLENLQTYESMAIYWYLLLRSVHSNTNGFSMFYHVPYVLLFCCFHYADSCFDLYIHIIYLCFIILIYIYICIYTHLFDFHNYPSYCNYSPFSSTSLPPAEETAIWCIEYRTYRNEGFLIESFSETWTCCVGWLCVDDVVKMCCCEKTVIVAA